MIVDIVFGFLGSGKTTFITKILNEWGDKEKIVVLVNEFGEVGIDGDLLTDQGGNIVEMPSGCICCTLQADFRSQMLDIVQTIRPERVIIEPTGVATIAQIRWIVEAQMFEKVITEIYNVLVADATGFMGLYKVNSHFVESQVKNARVVLLNKCDKVNTKRAMLTRDAITAINPDTTVLMTEFGAVDWAEYQQALLTPHSFGDWLAEGTFSTGPYHEPHHHEDEERETEEQIHLHVEEDALGYESFGCTYDDLSFDQKTLEDFFHDLNASEMGEIVRAKGIFRVGDRWVLMELASKEFSYQPVMQSNQSKVSIIGRGLNRKRIAAALEHCVSGEES
jgi:G3E family GTPase